MTVYLGGGRGNAMFTWQKSKNERKEKKKRKRKGRINNSMENPVQLDSPAGQLVLPQPVNFYTPSSTCQTCVLELAGCTVFLVSKLYQQSQQQAHVNGGVYQPLYIGRDAPSVRAIIICWVGYSSSTLYLADLIENWVQVGHSEIAFCNHSLYTWIAWISIPFLQHPPPGGLFGVRILWWEDFGRDFSKGLMQR